MAKRLTDLDVDRLVAEYNAGATTVELAAKYHTSPSTINARLKGRGDEVRWRFDKRWQR